MFGNTISTSVYVPERSVIGPVETSPCGNIVLRVGRENGQGWQQSEHVVMTTDEAIKFAHEVLAAAVAS